MAVRTVDWEQGAQNAWDNVVEFLPKLLAFIVILVIGWIIAKVVAKIVNAVLERVGFDKAVERGGVNQALERSRYDASDIVSKIVYWAILLLTLQLAFGVFGPNPVSDLLHDIIAFLPKILVAIIIVVIAAAIAAAVKDLIANALSGLSYGRLVANAAAIAILFLGIVAALGQIGVATTVTLPVLIAILAAITGVIIVGVGGGLIRPMEEQWRSWLDKAQQESKKLSSGKDAGREVTGPAGQCPQVHTTVEEERSN